jgi:hypothetical protein
MERIRTAVINSYKEDRIAFCFEFIGMAFTVAGSLLLALTAKDPDMLIVYPLFFIGSATGLYAYYRKQAIWTIVLTGHFVVINIVGFLVVVL